MRGDRRRKWKPRRDPERIRRAIVWQVAALLSEHRRRQASGSATPEDSYQLTRALKDRYLWSWTMAESGDAWTLIGKYDSVRYWSHGALRSYAAHGRAVQESNVPDALVHEHVVPRGFVASQLMALVEPNQETVVDVLDRWGLACVVTREEDRRLAEMDPGDPWQRYRDAGIEVVDLR